LPHFSDLLEALALPDVPSGVVWHHTDANGALGVIDGGAVWATWARYLNDETEVRHGIETIHAVWDEVREQYSRADLIERLLRDREERADELLSRCFVYCATVQVDSLSTYRGYGTYALGIDVSQFTPTFHHAREQITGEVPDGIGWKMVAYAQAEKVERCHRLFAAWQLLLDSWPTERSLSIAAQVWVDALYELTVVHMKHESFADEREARYYAWSEPHDGASWTPCVRQFHRSVRSTQTRGGEWDTPGSYRPWCT
jgi:hypothetical protein